MFGRSRHRNRLVNIAYRDLTSPPLSEDRTLSPQSGYVFIWGQREPPRPGMRVIVPGFDGPSPGIVLGDAKRKEAAGVELKTVRRIATEDDIRAAHKRKDADESAWLNMARRAAGLRAPGRARTKAIPGYPPIPPADGKATADEADHYGRTWWRVLKRAEEAQRPADEVKTYERIARRWFAVRNKGGNA